MEKLLAIINIGQRAYDRWLFQCILPGIIILAGLAIIIAMIISAIFVGGLYAAYITLINYSVSQDIAIIIIAISSIITIIILVIMACLALKHLCKPPRIIDTQQPLASFVITFLEAVFTNA
jgi:hypothetical protein